MFHLSANTYHITETVPTGWEQVSNTCATVNFPATRNCSIVNRKLASVTIHQETIPGGDTQTFSYTGTLGTPTLSDNGSQEFLLSPAVKSITQTLPTGWELTDLECSGSPSYTTDLNTRTISFNLSAGDDIDCTYTNTKNGSIVVKTETFPNASSQTFGYSNGLTANLTDGQSSSVSVVPGAYTVNQGAVAGWQNAAIVCDDNDSTGSAGTASFAVAAGETVTCTFYNVQAATVTVEKTTTNDVGTFPFVRTFDSSSSSFSLTTATQNVAVQSTAYEVYPTFGFDSSSSAMVTPVSVSLFEGATANWNATGVSCTMAASSSSNSSGLTASLSVTAGDAVTCSYTNEKSVCGNSQIQNNEQCDDGDTDSDDGCSSACQIESGWSCNGTPSVCTTSCGDGIKAGAEQCDDGNQTPGDGCSATCVNEVCGNGIQDPGEPCDDGNLVNTDSCTNVCQNAACGDTFVQNGEQCDDGNQTPGDGCSASCQNEVCGNGTTDPGETCDDGNASNTDSCLNSCTAPTCGDGYVWSGHEQCDDQNADNTDGCTASCAFAVPQCYGQNATVYVQGGVIVGGTNNGTTYIAGATTLAGSTGADVIFGTDSGDIIDGNAGNDVICGRGGDDNIQGDDGNDTVYAGDGDDDVRGGDGNDLLYGDAGSDHLKGDDNNDVLCGLANDDTLQGGKDDDRIDGGADSDHLQGQQDTDQCVNGENVGGDCETVTGSVPECSNEGVSSSAATSSGGSSSGGASSGGSSSAGTSSGGSSSAGTSSSVPADDLLSITKSADSSSAGFGAVVTYTITVTNNGSNSEHADDVIMTDLIPAGMTYVSTLLTNTTDNSFDEDNVTCGLVSGSVRCTLDSSKKLHAGKSMTFVVVLSNLNSEFCGDFINTASVTTSSSDPNLVNNSASVTVHGPSCGGSSSGGTSSGGGASEGGGSSTGGTNLSGAPVGIDDGGQGGVRGHRWNQIRAIARRLAALNGAGGTIANPAFGGSASDPLSPSEIRMICAAQRAIDPTAPEALFALFAQDLADSMDRPVGLIQAQLHNTTLCSTISAWLKPQQVIVTASVQPVLLATDGYPTSSNETWNKCVRGKATLADIRKNPDTYVERSGKVIAKSCDAYRTSGSKEWLHPDDPFLLLTINGNGPGKKPTVTANAGYVVIQSPKTASR